VDVIVPNDRLRSPLWEQPSLHGTLHRVRLRKGLAFAPASKSPVNIGVVACFIPVEAGLIAAIGVAAVGMEKLDRAMDSVVRAARETAHNLADKPLGVLVGV
jgi:hypothetical protein